MAAWKVRKTLYVILLMEELDGAWHSEGWEDSILTMVMKYEHFGVLGAQPPSVVTRSHAKPKLGRRFPGFGM